MIHSCVFVSIYINYYEASMLIHTHTHTHTHTHLRMRTRVWNQKREGGRDGQRERGREREREVDSGAVEGSHTCKYGNIAFATAGSSGVVAL